MLKLIKKIKEIIYYIDRSGIRIMNDKDYISFQFKKALKRELDLENPQSLNEKLQWIKLYDRNPEYTKMVDKYEVKEYVKNIIGEQYIIPTLGIYDNFNQIDFDKLPNQFVMKCTHDSGSTIICKDKKTFDIDKAKKVLTKSLRHNFYYKAREWPYKNIKRRIIIEKYMKDDNLEDLEDFKLQCFNGVVDNIFVCVERYTETGVKYHYFDRNWNYLPYCPYEGIDATNVGVARPEKLDEMIEISEKLSKGIPEVRVDLYYINGKIYFGELTFFSHGGYDLDITYEADMEMGKRMSLPK